tara:strand:+ start:1364 stop:2227 length:864 start_codon:yes stop_codon:yes gene_type:complete
MIETDTQTQCQLIEKKRQMLASLIRIAQGINKHTQGLEDVLLLVRPSQTYPAKIDQYITLLESKTATLTDGQLIKEAKKYDDRCKQLINILLKVVDKIQKQIEEAKEIDSFSDEIQEQLKAFKTMTQTAVGLRVILQKRGVVLTPVQFGFPQEWFVEQVDSLQQTNRELRVRVKTLALELILDVKQILNRQGVSQKLRDCLNYTENAMQENLKHLNAGGSLDNLPHEFENLIITSTANAPADKIYQSDPEMPEETPEEPETVKKQLNLSGKIKLWLSSSWKTRWRDL